MNDAARIRNIRDRLRAGHSLSQEDAAVLAGAIEIAMNGAPLERALRWPGRWRSQVRFLDAVAGLSMLCVGRSCRADAQAIMRNPFAMKRLTLANGGKRPCFDKVRRALSAIGANMPGETAPEFSTGSVRDDTLSA
ncbi:hypothetical protein [Bradyrhizobium elkanii]